MQIQDFSSKLIGDHCELVVRRLWLNKAKSYKDSVGHTYTETTLYLHS